MLLFKEFFCYKFGASILIVLATILAPLLTKAVISVWWKPRRIQKVFEAQGIKCLPRPLFFGNLAELAAINKQARARSMPQISHDVTKRIFPHFYDWSQKYGELFVFWFGSQAQVFVMEPEQAKEVLSNKSGNYKKLGERPDTRDMGGAYGLADIEGETWARHRRILNPSFFPERLKPMASKISLCTASILEAWQDQITNHVEINVDEEFKNLAADIISLTAFGGNFAEAKRLVDLQREQQIMINELRKTVYVPGLRFLPTAKNRHRWKLNNKIIKILTELIQRRMDPAEMSHADSQNDLLGMMLAANEGELQGKQKNLRMGLGEIVDECKTFFVAGYETSSVLLSWTFLLLAISQEWQERVREEIHQICGKTELPTADCSNSLRILGMVLNEALRLYPPAFVLARRAASDLKLGKVTIPAETVLLLPIILWHHDQRLWGPDAHEFKPDRFSDGMTKASTVPGAFMPFSVGHRSCIGQAYVMLEVKMVVATILQRYRFSLSPHYCHSPTAVLTLQPEFGVPLLFEKL